MCRKSNVESQESRKVESRENAKSDVRNRRRDTKTNENCIVQYGQVYSGIHMIIENQSFGDTLSEPPTQRFEVKKVGSKRALLSFV